MRFLLAGHAGAGKTVMAGLLIRELKLRGLAERILIVCSANLCFQWERELKDKFDEKFKRLKGDDLDPYSMNQWLENPQVITSLDLAEANALSALYPEGARKNACLTPCSWQCRDRGEYTR